MKIIRYLDPQGNIRFAGQSPSGDFCLLTGDIFRPGALTDTRAEIARVLAPIAPTQIMGVGLNYRRHAEESGAKIPTHPVLFFKGVNSLQDPGEPILLPRHLASEEVDYECELAVVLARNCKNVSPSEALNYVLGYTCANDVSARDWQLRLGGGQWCRGKTFDTFTPLGPCLVTADEIPNPAGLGIRTVLNGVVVQDWKTDDMIFDIPKIISFLSGSTTLPAGTVILTGTPHGVGMAAKPSPRWLTPGDIVAVQIDGIGELINPVHEEA